MNKFIYIIIVGFLLLSCTSNTILKKPDNLIPKDEMVDLLTDLFIAMNAQNTKNIDLKRNVDYFPLVFEKYKIDSTQFKESNYYYTSKVDDYDEILNEVQKRLEKLNEFYNKEKKLKDSLETATKKTEDSIKRVERFKKPIRKPTSIDKTKK
jgi:DNA repair ATPase RecN